MCDRPYPIEGLTRCVHGIGVKSLGQARVVAWQLLFHGLEPRLSKARIVIMANEISKAVRSGVEKTRTS